MAIAKAKQKKRIIVSGHLNAEQITTLTVIQLKKLADDMGMAYKPQIKKDDLVTSICSVEVTSEVGMEAEKLVSADT